MWTLGDISFPNHNMCARTLLYIIGKKQNLLWNLNSKIIHNFNYKCWVAIIIFPGLRTSATLKSLMWETSFQPRHCGFAYHTFNMSPICLHLPLVFCVGKDMLMYRLDPAVRCQPSPEERPGMYPWDNVALIYLRKGDARLENACPSIWIKCQIEPKVGCSQVSPNVLLLFNNRVNHHCLLKAV